MLGSQRIVAAIFAMPVRTSMCAAQVCGPGTFSTTGNAPCTPCAAGTFAATTGPASCSPCAAGSYGPGVGAAFCQPCPAGMFNPFTAASQCTACPAGMFAAPGATSCTDCAFGLPVFNQEPAAVSAVVGETVVLMAHAVSPAGLSEPAYYWRRNGVTIMDGDPFMGAGSATQVIADVTFAEQGEYDAVAINGCGYQGSGVGVVKVFCKADFNRNSVVTVQDIFDFLAAWFGGC